MAEEARVAVIGTTSWGTTLAILLSLKGLDVVLWARTDEEAQRINREGQNSARMPQVSFPPSLKATASLDEALADAALAILAVPSQRMRENVKTIRGYLSPDTLVMSAAKGLELDTGLRMSQVIAQELQDGFKSSICVLSGPNLSQEIVQGMPSATVVAAEDSKMAERARDLVMAPGFRSYSSSDIIGVELGGALKNIIALGAGISDGWGYGANSKAAFITRGLAEITRLGVAAGANPLTFLGLAGLGDMMATCFSPLSRNRHVGEELAKGRLLQDILFSMSGVAEGVPTTKAALQLAGRLGIEMPITESMYRVLYEGYNVRAAAAELMGREPKDELSGLSGP